MVRVKILRPLQISLTTIVPNKHPSEALTLKRHMNLCHNHHRGRVITLQRLRSTILLPNIFRNLSLVIIEAANTTHALSLTLTTQKYTDIDVCKILFQHLFVCHSHFQFLPSSHTHHSTFLFSNLGAYSFKYFISTKDTVH